MQLVDDSSISARVVRRYRMRNRILIIASAILSILLIILMSLLIHRARKQQSLPDVYEKGHGSPMSSSSSSTITTTTATTSFVGTTPADTSSSIITSTSTTVTTTSASKPSLKICSAATWSKKGITVAGGTNSGSGLNQLTIPVDMFVNSEDAIYIADSFNHRIVKWNPGASEGIVVVGGGTAGNRTHELNYVTGLFVDSEESIYVADNHNHRVQKFKKDSKHATTLIGEYGPGSGINQINNCWGLYVDKKFNIYVSEHSNHRITKWSPGAKIGQRVAFVSKPLGIHVDESNDDVYVASYSGDCVYRYSTDRKPVQRIGEKVLNSPYDFAFVPGFDSNNRDIIIADSEHHRVVKMNLDEPDLVTIIAGITNQGGSSAEEFNEPRRVRFDSKGNLLVLDSNNNRVQKFLIENNKCDS
ncbi:unnamed protein product [Adineta ricciae]|uniref:Uncharacterized protein n=1 Tax=Adineta ricciae TaxID=249248 RepID=A0A813RCX3_ADIRI|nr:unnamed protein product [Adineta ricciae]CAF1186167.1 unnamed protein product [Adineta ricciae]